MLHLSYSDDVDALLRTDFIADLDKFLTGQLSALANFTFFYYSPLFNEHHH